MGWVPPPPPPRSMFKTEEGYQRALQDYKRILGDAAERYDRMASSPLAWAAVVLGVAFIICAVWRVLG